MIWAVIAVVIGGMAAAVQAPLNAALGRELGAVVPAVAVSFGSGFVVLVVVAALTGQAGAFLKLGSVPGWMLFGGMLGAIYVLSVTWGVSQLGVVTMIAALVFGQMATAMVIDSTGILGMAVREISLQRIAAAGLVAAGLVLSRL
jgi:bacterial/archaeal transporter family-2 protein